MFSTFQSLDQDVVRLYANGKLYEEEKPIEVEALDEGKWWIGTLLGSRQTNGQLVHVVKCKGFKKAEVKSA